MRRIEMDIISNLNERLSFDEDRICYGGEDKIKKVLSESPVKLPDDYIDFLRTISGGENVGITFEVKDEGLDISIWSAEVALRKKTEDFSYPSYKDFMECSWLLGDDLGDLVYFYGEGNEGFGLYRGSVGGLDYKYADKIADTLTDFLVNGTGIDIAITL